MIDAIHIQGKHYMVGYACALVSMRYARENGEDMDGVVHVIGVPFEAMRSEQILMEHFELLER
jgi:hypothetical protein